MKAYKYPPAQRTFCAPIGRWFKWSGYVLISVLVSIWLVACGNAKSDSVTEEPVVVVAYEVAPAEAQLTTYTGVVHARTESHLGFRVGGKVQQRLVDPGDRVTKGQELLRLDRTDFRLDENIAQADVDAARATMIQAREEEQRLARLVALNAVSVQSHEMAKASYDAAVAKLKSAQARAAQIANQNTYSTLTADADSIILDTFVDVGQVVSAGQTVVLLAHDGEPEAVVDLPETDVESAPSTGTASLYVRPEKLYQASLREISALANPLTRSYRARYVLDSGKDQVPLGATINLYLENTRNNGSIEIPITALLDDRLGQAVWIIDPKTLRLSRRPVGVAGLTSSTALISTGLKAGNLIVAMGATLLEQGQLVSVRNNSRLLARADLGEEL